MALHRSLSFSGVFFDFDGTLLNNESVHRLAIRTVFEQFTGAPLADEELLPLAGLTYDERLHRLFARRNIVDDDAIARLEQEARVVMKAHELQGDLVVPGAREFVESLSEHGVEMAVVSSAMRGRIEHLLEAAQMLEYFSTITGREEVSALKPDPASYVHTMELLELSPTATVVFEDSPSGIAAARAAGLPVVGLTTTFPADVLKGTIATISNYSTFTVNDLDLLIRSAS